MGNKAEVDSAHTQPRASRGRQVSIHCSECYEAEHWLPLGNVGSKAGGPTCGCLFRPREKVMLKLRVESAQPSSRSCGVWHFEELNARWSSGMSKDGSMDHEGYEGKELKDFSGSVT